MTNTTDENTTRKPHRRRNILIGGALLVVVLGGYGLYRFLAGDAPPPVDLDRTVSAVTTTQGTSTTVGRDGIEGEWTVDTSIGEFAFEDASSSFAGFRVDEQLSGIGAAEAVGRTPVVSGTIDISGEQLVSAEFEADLSEIVSNESRREGAIQSALNTRENPVATFTLTAPVELGGGAAGGEVVAVTAVGDLSVNGITNSVELAIEAQLVDGKILVTGSTPIVFADYGVTAPRAPIVLSVADNGTLEFQFWLT